MRSKRPTTSFVTLKIDRALKGAIEQMLEIFANLFAYGPPGGIEGGLAVKWVVIWTVILGGSLYLSLFYPQWLKLDDDH
ncbi:MAG: hypothetical protein WC423_13135 [Vulcanimicrobiota bacterium]